MNEIEKALEAVDKIEADYILPDYQQKLSYSEVDALFKKIRAALEGMRWRPIESAPMTDAPILAYDAEYAGFNVEVVTWMKDFCSHGCFSPSHWMPLPKPPAQEGEE